MTCRTRCGKWTSPPPAETPSASSPLRGRSRSEALRFVTPFFKAAAPSLLKSRLHFRIDVGKRVLAVPLKRLDVTRKSGFSDGKSGQTQCLVDVPQRVQGRLFDVPVADFDQASLGDEAPVLEVRIEHRPECLFGPAALLVEV